MPAERRRIGYVFQDARLFPHYSVRGNLLYGAPRAPRAGLFDDVVALLGLEALLQRRPNALSGGERQRVALGRALLAEPRLLLLDEPLASLDQSRRDEVLPFLVRLRDHFALPMIHVSHQFDEVLRLATRLVVMEHGDLVGMLTFREVIQAVVKNGGSVGTSSIRSVMDDHPLTCTPETEIDEVRRMMLDRHARYLPVMDQRTLMGVISFYDVAKAVVESQDFENRMLKAYIRDWPVEEAGEAPTSGG